MAALAVVRTLALLVLLCARAEALASQVYQEESVSIPTKDLTLEGTLAFPALRNGASPSCALLLPGSGPTDRDGNQPGLTTDLHRQLARHLAKVGVVTLRFDKRAVARYATAWPKTLEEQNAFFAWESFVSDAEAAWRALQKDKRPKNPDCAVLGHSEGGLIALALAGRVKIKTLVLMATPGRPLAEVLNAQVSALLEKQGATPADRKFFLSESRRVIDFIIQNGSIPTDVPPGLRALFPPSAATYLKTALRLEPGPLAKTYSGFASVLNGMSDVQVDPSLDAEALYKILQVRGKKQESITLFPGLSHNFKRLTSPSDLGLAGEVPAEVLDLVSKVLLRR